MQIQNPWGALAFLLLVPLVLLYLLKQRYQEVKVPSTFLWSQVLAQWEAAHPWQKWRRNLLFFLQFLAICLLALALMRPVWRTSGVGENSIIVLDVSMSMQAEENGRTRLDRAKEGVANLVEQMQRHEEVSLILSGGQNELLVSKSGDKAAILQLLDQTEAQNGSSQLEEALQLANSILDPENNERIYLFTDQDIPAYDANTTLYNVALGWENVAITGLSHSHSSRNGSLNVLGLLYNFGQAKSVHVELWGDGALLDIRECALEEDSPANVLFDGLDGSLSQITLSISEEDALMADNQAYLVVQDDQTYRVLLQTERNVFLEKAILLRDDIELYKTTISETVNTQENYALVIGDGWINAELPEQQNLWIIAPQRDTSWFELDPGAEGEIRISGTGVGDSLLRYVDLSGLQVADTGSFTVGDGETSVLAYIDDRPLIIMGEFDGTKRLAFGFDFHDSNLPLQKDFPILVQNILQWFLPAREGQINQATVGNSVLIALRSDAASYEVRLPDGSVLPGREQRQFEDTWQLGFYTVTQYGESGEIIDVSGFAVNAPVLEESELRTASALTGDQAGGAAELWRRWNLWPYLIISALILMALEWWVYHRGA